MTEDGCPCGTNGKCCNNPETFTPAHEEPENDSFCDECYVLECSNCGKSCGCSI